MKNIFNDKNFLGYLIPRFSVFLMLVSALTFGFSLVYYTAHTLLGMEIKFKTHILGHDLFEE